MECGDQGVPCNGIFTHQEQSSTSNIHFKYKYNIPRTSNTTYYTLNHCFEHRIWHQLQKEYIFHISKWNGQTGGVDWWTVACWVQIILFIIMHDTCMHHLHQSIKNICFYTAQRPTQSVGSLEVFYTLPTGRHVHSGTNSTSLGTIQLCCNYCRRLQSNFQCCIYPCHIWPMYSFIQMNELRRHWKNENAQ